VNIDDFITAPLAPFQPSYVTYAYLILGQNSATLLCQSRAPKVTRIRWHGYVEVEKLESLGKAYSARRTEARF
jgi:hypothetical protein